MLVTGFFDWLDLEANDGQRSERRLRDNPSGRLIESAGGGPGRGPLALLLGEGWRDRVGVDVAFEVLPVRWGVSAPLHQRPLDLLVHLGWGRQVPADALWLELDAHNGREGVDVSGLARTDRIAAGAGGPIRAAPHVRRHRLKLTPSFLGSSPSSLCGGMASVRGLAYIMHWYDVCSYAKTVGSRS